MQRRTGKLPERASGAAIVRRGRAVAATLGPLDRVLVTGAERGVFATDDFDCMANRVYTQMLGCMHFACVGGVREWGPGAAETFNLHRERVRQACVQESLPLMQVTAGASA